MHKRPVNIIFLDIGSTIIKLAQVSADGVLSGVAHFQRDFSTLAAAQVEKILRANCSVRKDSPGVRICSSANGGLRVGVVGFTSTFSTRVAKQAVLNAGANVVWIMSAEEKPDLLAPVDLCVLTGGTDGAPSRRQKTWLREVAAMPILAEAMVFSGNKKLMEFVQELWPNVHQTENVLGPDMRWNGDSLSALVREAYLRDLVSRKGIEGLQELSDVAILPTPAVVELAYNAILQDETEWHLPSPFLLIDGGGATTDVFYGQELLVGADGGRSQAACNRHVFTSLGVAASRDSLLAALVSAERLLEFLCCVDQSAAERRYEALREGDVSWVTLSLLSEAAIFLALDALADGAGDAPKLALERVAAIVVTGGASQLCGPSVVRRVAEACGATSTIALMDSDYKVWIEGMARIQVAAPPAREVL